mmetsp:Transcript_7024/g.20712  ORF Transcript_7024/g.20712 Transcript_7024/m.20712 type:complete len:348 (+) Transcript_7024:882-1925(+)
MEGGVLLASAGVAAPLGVHSSGSPVCRERCLQRTVIKAQRLRCPAGAPRGSSGCHGGRVLRQLVRQTDRVALRVLGRGQHDVAVALQADGADVTQALVLEHLRQLRVPQGRLAQLRVEPRAKEPLHVRERHGARARLHAPEEVLEARAHHLPRGHAAGAPGRARARPLALRATLLDHGLGAGVGHNSAVEVAQQLLLGDGKLHDVANLAQRPAAEQGQGPREQDLRARVAATGQHHVLHVQALKVRRGSPPELARVEIGRAVDVDEGEGAGPEERRPVATLLGLDAEPGAGLAEGAELLDVHVHGPGARELRVLAQALAQDPAVGPQLVVVEALDGPQHVRHLEPET